MDTYRNHGIQHKKRQQKNISCPLTACVVSSKTRQSKLTYKCNFVTMFLAKKNPLYPLSQEPHSHEHAQAPLCDTSAWVYMLPEVTLYSLSQRERQIAACVKVFPKQQCIRHKKMIKDFNIEEECALWRVLLDLMHAHMLLASSLQWIFWLKTCINNIVLCPIFRTLR